MKIIKKKEIIKHRTKKYKQYFNKLKGPEIF